MIYFAKCNNQKNVARRIYLMNGNLTLAKRLLAGLLAVLMIFSLMPANVYASEEISVEDKQFTEFTEDTQLNVKFSARFP